MATGDSFESEVRYRRADDGQYHWFLTRAVPLHDRRGKIIKWYGTSTDIEDSKRAELLRAELAHVNRINMMGELTASLAHEIKQPIADLVKMRSRRNTQMRLPILAALVTIPDGGRNWARFSMITLISGCMFLPAIPLTLATY